MSEWLKNIVGFLLIVSIVMQMLPGKKYEQYVKLFTGFLLILIVLQPVLKIGSANSFLEQTIEEFVAQQEILERKIGTETEDFREQSERLQPGWREQVSVSPVETVEVILDE